MHILITGAFGFVGSNLSRALAAAGKHRLIALDLFQLVAQGHLFFPPGLNCTATIRNLFPGMNSIP